jgi:histidinol-phosphate aminotransferase
VLVPTPTFAMFAVEARLAGARVVELPRTDPAVRQDVDDVRRAVAASAARLVWLCTPNNPTGDLWPLAEIRAIADALPAVVVVDEVYLDFAEDAPSAVELQNAMPNVLVLRSLAKSHGLAGGRLGYLVVPDGLADRFDAIRLPLSVSAATEAAALGALEDEEAARDRLRQVRAATGRLADTIEATGSRVLPSVTNFVTFRPLGDAATVDAELLARGVAVRRYDAGPIAGWLRVTARLGAEERQTLAALREVLK